MKNFDLELCSPRNAKCNFLRQEFNGAKRRVPFILVHHEAGAFTPAS